MSPSPPTDPVFADILGWAKGIAIHQGAERLDASHLLLGALKSKEGLALLGRLLPATPPPERSLTSELREQLKEVTGPVTDTRLDLTPRLKQITDDLWRRHGDLRAEQVLRAIISALRDEESWVKQLCGTQDLAPSESGPQGIGAVRSLLDVVEGLRQALAERIIGQDRAIDMVCDAHFSTQLRHSTQRPDSIAAAGPRMILTFLGPSGVGKTYLAEILAHHFGTEEEPALLRLDMSAYAGHQAHEQLVGFNPSYSGSNRGLLTGFALDHPEGFIIVDEVEKAHPNTQNIFLQLLDSGRVYDNNLRRDADFTQTVVIFTTNLGRAIYDAPERAGILADSRQLTEAVVQALRKEPREPGEAGSGLSAELLSRMTKGCIVLFSRLNGLALERIADMTIRQISAELKQSVGLSLDVPDTNVLTLLVLRFGSVGDARRLTTGLRNYIYAATKELLHDHREWLLEGDEPLLPRLQGLRLVVQAPASIPATIEKELTRPFTILLIDDDAWEFAEDSDCMWTQVAGRKEADDQLRHGQTDLVLLDLHIGSGRAERRMDAGLGILRWLRSRFPRVPVYLFSETPEKRGLSPEALERVSQEGGAHGILQKRFFGNSEQDALERGSFFRQLDEVIAALRRQNVIERYQRRFTVVEFDLQPNRTPSDDGHLLLELSGMREITAVSAQDREVTGWVDLPRDRFDDIAGAEQAKQRLREVVAWLSDPRPVIDLGLELPKGILLTGPPGTGKTSLARAVAGESQVPFFAISGASVFRKYVGESEAAIRNLFAVARRYAPAVIFIDEIDAIGTQRSDRADHAARVGVLNELLAQMDGFAQGAQPIFVMAATNRPDILDPALVRAGRFDLQVEVPVPNAPAREQILGIYLRGMALAEDVDVTRLAARTIGMSGADIRQVCKEAGFLALREGSPTVTHHHMDEAITVVRFGLSSERMLLDDAAKWSTAVHEAGHALAQHLIFPDEPVTQVSILPRGRSLGFTEHVPGKEYIDQSLGHVRGTVRVLLAGRAAEEIMLGDEGITSGCADDLARASALVLRMVSAWGMDEEVGLLSLPGVRQGLSVAEGVPLRSAHHEEAIAASRRWLTQEAAAVRKLLKEHKDALRRIAEAVAAQETLGEKELRPLLASQPTKEIEHGHDPQGNR